jgi:hypothetical protein
MRSSKYNERIVAASITVAWLFLLLVMPSSARAQLATATITGTVKDASGAVIPHASVVLQNVESGVTQKGITNDAGIYVFPGVLPGRYTLSE